MSVRNLIDCISEEEKSIKTAYHRFVAEVKDNNIKDVSLDDYEYLAHKYKQSRRWAFIQFSKGKRLMISLLLVVFSTYSFGQVHYKRPLFDCIYDTTYHATTYVHYKVYKGGGECPRSSYRFKNKYPVHSGLDHGHLVPFEDFAYDCDAVLTTYDSLNTAPQYPSLNRGMWKITEDKVRKYSQEDTIEVFIRIIYDDNSTFMKDGRRIPTYFVKTAKRLDGSLLFCEMFTNLPVDNKKYILEDE